MLGPFRVLHRIGAGGMGAVYRAVHTATGHEVALKTVLVAHANELAAIRTEIEALRRLDHPGIVRILDAGSEAGSPWYAMELLEGRSLHDFQRAFWSEWQAPSPEPEQPADHTPTVTHRTGESGPVFFAGRMVSGAPAAAGKLVEALTLVHRLCAPLGYLHQLGIVHRDLKPGNVFVRPDGRPVVMDFGLVSRFGASGRDVLEIAGSLAGTAAYMAPEQILRQRVDARSDLYALGCILYELLTGRPPFVGDTIGELLQRHLTEPPRPPSQIVTGLPPSLDELIDRMLAKHVRERIGHADDVSAWLVDLGAEPDATVAQTTTVKPAYLYRPELAGRSDVLEALNRHVQRLLAGVGGCVLLGGESGVGKTSVVAEVARAATLQHLVVVAGECQPIGGGVLHPLAPLLGRIIDRTVEGGPAIAATLFGNRAKVLAAVEPGVMRVPGFADLPMPEELPPDAARARLLADLRETVAAFTEERPVLLVLDDLQWADPLTLQFLLTTKQEFFERNALLLVGTYRSDEQPEILREVLSLSTIGHFGLGRLDAAAVGAMVGDMLALADPPRGFVEFVAAQSEGNPFFVAEYLRTAVAERLLQRTGGRWTFGDAGIESGMYANLALPASLRELVERRLSGLPRGAQRLAQIGSVLGREIDAALLLAASGMAEADAMEAIRELASRQVLDRVEGGRYRFLHDKLREVAYAAIPAGEAAGLHRRAAESLEAVYAGTDEFSRLQGRLAMHYERAGDRPRAIDYFEKASEDALRAFADRDVVDTLTSALRLDDEQGSQVEPQRRTAWRTSVGVALRGLGEQEQARAMLEQSLAERGYPVATGSATSAARHVLRELVLRRSLASPPVSPRVSDPEAERALNAYNYVAMIAYHQRDVSAQILSTFAGLKLAPRVGPSAPAAQLYAGAGNILGFFGLAGTAWKYARLSHEIARATGQGVALGVVAQYSGHLAALLGDMTTFDADMHGALEIYTRIGHQRFREEALTNCGHLYALRGELSRSLEAFREIERSGLTRDDQQTTGWGMLGQARILGLMGQTDEALRRLDDAVPKARDDLSQLEGLATRALTHAQRGDHRRSRDDIAAVLKVMERASTTSYTSIWAYSNAAEAIFHLQPAGERIGASDTTMARRLLVAFKRFARIIPVARPRLALWSGVFASATGRPWKATRAWKRALGGASRIGLPLDLALLHLWIGRCSAGEERVRHLTEAITSFDRMQAAWHAACARRLLEPPAPHCPGDRVPNE
jgi:serine/threonine protein kinase/tetratricopeptide (TPR) repeat protein